MLLTRSPERCAWSRLTERATHAAQGGALAEYRKVKKALGEIRKVTDLG
jgi:hypothetical protein